MSYFQLSAVEQNILTNTSCDVFASLPLYSDHYGEVWLVQNPSGVYGFRNLAGFYRAGVSSWVYLGNKDTDITAILDAQVCYEDYYAVDANAASTKSFVLTKAYVPTSERVFWNGLGQSQTHYSVQGANLIFNQDTPLTIGDEIWIKYLVQG